jgi:hypothetical protein
MSPQEVRQARLRADRENTRGGAAVRQRVIANLGRADELAASGALASTTVKGTRDAQC